MILCKFSHNQSKQTNIFSSNCKKRIHSDPVSK